MGQGVPPPGLGGLESRDQMRHEQPHQQHPQRRLAVAHDRQGRLQCVDASAVGLPIGIAAAQANGGPGLQPGLPECHRQLHAFSKAIVRLVRAAPILQSRPQPDQRIHIINGRLRPQRRCLLVASDGLIGGRRRQGHVAGPDRPGGRRGGCGWVDGGHGRPVAGQLGRQRGVRRPPVLDGFRHPPMNTGLSSISHPGAHGVSDQGVRKREPARSGLHHHPRQHGVVGGVNQASAR